MRGIKVSELFFFLYSLWQWVYISSSISKSLESAKIQMNSPVWSPKELYFLQYNPFVMQLNLLLLVQFTYIFFLFSCPGSATVFLLRLYPDCILTSRLEMQKSLAAVQWRPLSHFQASRKTWQYWLHTACIYLTALNA